LIVELGGGGVLLKERICGGNIGVTPGWHYSRGLVVLACGHWSRVLGSSKYSR
jgi:hypothetical protein